MADLEFHKQKDRRNNLDPRIQFEVNEVEQARFEEFSKEHLEKCPHTPQDAMHTRWSFIFTLGGVGTIVEVKCILCGETKNITDFDSW